MLSLWGTQRKLCDGISRRELLRVGGLSALGWGLQEQWGVPSLANAVSSPSGRPSFGRAKACILLFLYGSPPQHETFDPKPEAPAEIQGEMKAIATPVPGLNVCERLPRTARLVDRTTVVRSLTHPYPLHGVAYAVSGLPTYTQDLETRPRDVRHWPFIGSVVDYAQSQRVSSASTELPSAPAVPRHMALPWMLNSKTDLLVNAGPFAGFLGARHDPIWTDFNGKGTRKVPKYTDGQQQEFVDPYGGVTADGAFQLSQDSMLQPELSLERLGMRRSLLAQLNRTVRHADRLAAAGFDVPRQQAYELLTSTRLHAALDLQREPASVREAYGMTLFGQSCLAARRLVEGGVRFVTVFWDGFGQFANCAWDTHNNHFPRLKEYLLPGFDLAYPALIEDLDQRGLLDETLVLCLSEHGRTPQIDSKPKGAGRHHWSRAYSAILAGGGIARGRVVGATDRLAGEVVDTPVSPKDVLATSLHLLGVDPHLIVRDPQGRPVPVAGAGRVREELLG
ncbi:MAG: DUF1501 domain-containing protein [Pirellulaceae bacterium]